MATTHPAVPPASSRDDAPELRPDPALLSNLEGDAKALRRAHDIARRDRGETLQRRSRRRE